MKNIIYLSAILFSSVLLMAGCNDTEVVENSGSNLRTVTASFSEVGTRVGLEMSGQNSNMLAKWQQDDKIHVFLTKQYDVTEVGYVPVKNISSNGKSCEFKYGLPENYDPLGKGYRLTCLTNNCEAKIMEGDIYCNATLIRMPISQFKARMLFDTYVTEENSFATFTHYGTYELLHITNNSDKSIKFMLNGFSSDYDWYRKGGTAYRIWDKTYITDLTYEVKSQSPAVTIPAQGSDIIVSWYIPTGKPTIENAQLVADIDGKIIKTENTISYDKTIQVGHAYHMYATWDGEKLVFEKGEEEMPSWLSCPDNKHPHVIDMGKAGKWACCNVGAKAPWEYGGYYAWGETEEKDYYFWNTYTHCDGSSSTCHDLGSDIAGTKYDVAHVKWGSKWRMPSKEQLKFLFYNCSSEWTTINGINGRKFTDTNGGSIFLPAAGNRWKYDSEDVGSYGDYWTSTQMPNESDAAYFIFFDSESIDPLGVSRSCGQSVRPVTE